MFDPLISLESMKKEQLDDFKSGNWQWPSGEGEAVRAHDFIAPESGKQVPVRVDDATNRFGRSHVGDPVLQKGHASRSLPTKAVTPKASRGPTRASPRLILNYRVLPE